jgi:hypothetical protein
MGRFGESERLWWEARLIARIEIPSGFSHVLSIAFA